jgi:hypothetical protein
MFSAVVVFGPSAFWAFIRNLSVCASEGFVLCQFDAAFSTIVATPAVELWVELSVWFHFC